MSKKIRSLYRSNWGIEIEDALALIRGGVWISLEEDRWRKGKRKKEDEINSLPSSIVWTIIRHLLVQRDRSLRNIRVIF